MRLVDADALIDIFEDRLEKIRNRYGDYSGEAGVCAGSLHLIREQPTIEERKTGKWIDYAEDGYVECPFCHSATNCDGNIEELHFCFSCGAKMEEQA